MPVRSFSGAHTFREECLRNALELGKDAILDADYTVVRALNDLLWEIERGFCPRCRDVPFEETYPAGSRETVCRCIPICHLCGRHEALGETRFTPWEWYWDPPDQDYMHAELAIVDRKSRTVEAIVSDGVMVTPDGAYPLVNPRNTGGWSELGDDEEE